ncbi:MAG: hypothetical protein N2043_09700 [Ignavibacterium sp.]|nr:hypothetical protein [Ignavibacterium sp.]
MPINKDKGKIARFGGGVLKIREVNDDGTPVENAQVLDLGYIQETTLSDTTDIEVVTDETGAQVQSYEGNRSVRFTGVLMQSDADLMNFFKETCRNRYYQVYYRANSNVNGNVQEILFGIVRIKPQVELASSTRRIPFEFNVLKNETLITVSNANTLFGSVAQTFQVPANNYYVIVDTPIQVQ